MTGARFECRYLGPHLGLVAGGPRGGDRLPATDLIAAHTMMHDGMTAVAKLTAQLGVGRSTLCRHLPAARQQAASE